ncbi:tail sheath protein [Arthrobacter phage Abba]|uniref:Tail sheath protein n=1 Tax=Arthrobacter phage Abba TaxID=2713256 RepID=A0A6G8R2E6_9CAUD|nr:tail sheath protein [Arthrobacter phage Abba]QIN94343.1 tail sheath protein [Arthrobacter phage Abba]
MASIGVEVTTSLRSGPSNPGVTSGRFHVAGLTQFGPINKGVVVRSLAQYLATFGDRTPYSSAMFDTARLFFEEGGSELVVSRVVGPAATRGSITLKDTAGVDTVKIEAVDPGAASASLSVEVTESGDTFGVIIRRDGDVIVRFVGLTSPSDFVSKAATNQFVNVTSLGSATAAPGDNPDTVAPVTLTVGTDDRASVTIEHVIAALEAAGSLAAGGAVAAPGYTVDTIGAQLAAHAKASKKIALLAVEPGATRADVIASATAFGDNADGDAAGIFYPSLIVPDGGGTRVVGPEGYVAAVRAKAHRDVGAWQAPAGDRARTRWALGTDVPVDVASNNLLNDARVNGIVSTGINVRLYGYASLAIDVDNMGMLTARDVLNNLAIGVSAALEPYVFGNLDGKRHLLGFIESAVTGVLDPIAKRDGFYSASDEEGNEIDPGYRVVVDTSLNTVGTARDNKVVVNVGVRLSPSAQLIQVEIIKVALGASV